MNHILTTMKQPITTLFFVLISSFTIAQEEIRMGQSTPNGILYPRDTEFTDIRIKGQRVVVESGIYRPQFKGGSINEMYFLQDNLRYPNVTLDSNIQGNIELSFVVLDDGTIPLEFVTILESPHDSLSAEALRLISIMPPWVPGKINYKTPVHTLHEHTIEIVRPEVHKDTTTVFESGVVPAAFPGGTPKKDQFVKDNIELPESMQNLLGGSVKVEFVIDQNGHIVAPTIIKSYTPDCDQEAIRVLYAMPVWKPALRNGKRVKSKQSIYFNFYKTDR